MLSNTEESSTNTSTASTIATIRPKSHNKSVSLTVSGRNTELRSDNPDSNPR